MRWPLRYQIMIPMAAAMLAAIIGLSVLNAYLAGQRATAIIRRQVANVTRTLVKSNFPLTEQVLQQMRGLSGADFVLVDDQGRLVAASSDIKASDLPYPDSQQDPGGPHFVEAIQVGGNRYYAALLTLPRRHVTAAPRTLHVLYPEHEYRDAWQRAVQPPLIIGGASLAIVVLIGITIASRVSRPMDRLRVQMGRIAEGQFVPIPLPHRHDEVRDLAMAVNRMAEMLARYEQQVRRTEQIHTFGHLVNAIAHQLRNSATGAMMALDIHRQECPHAPASESLDVASRQLDLIEKHLQKFLSLDIRSPGEYTEVDFVELLDSLVPLLRPIARHAGVKLETRWPDKPSMVQGNRDALEHMLLNLFLNAIEAAGQVGNKPADRQPCVAAELLFPGREQLQFTVEDSGPGPSVDVSTRMFEPFVTNKPHGTGLGLSLAQNIVAAHQGTIRWERRQERTRFTVQLPRLIEEVNRGKTVDH